MVNYAKSLVDDIEFSCEDASRSDPDFLYEVIQLAISAGATTINIPDTVGFTTPSEFGKLIADINKNCLLYTSPSPRDRSLSRMPSSA